jgi:hypothetical protein
MSVIDKYDPISGGFRAPLNAAYGTAEVALGVSLNASGRVVAGGAGQSGFVGVICMGRAMAAGEIVDVMTDGELVEVPTIPAGTKVYADAVTGALTATATANTYVGHTVEAGRLVVRFKRP